MCCIFESLSIIFLFLPFFVSLNALQKPRLKHPWFHSMVTVVGHAGHPMVGAISGLLTQACFEQTMRLSTKVSRATPTVVPSPISNVYTKGWFIIYDDHAVKLS